MPIGYGKSWQVTYSYISRIVQFPKQTVNTSEYIYWGLFKKRVILKCAFFYLIYIKELNI